MNDIFLYDRAPWGLNDIIVGAHAQAGGAVSGLIETVARARARRQPRQDELANLPIESQSLFGTLTEQYGEHTARYVYLRMKQNKLGPFKPGAKYGRK